MTVNILAFNGKFGYNLGIQEAEMKKIIIIWAAMVLLAANAWADTVTFKSGKKVEGTIKAINNDTITVDLYGVTEMTYELADIQEINGQIVDLKPSPAAPPQPAQETARPEETVETPPAPKVEPAPVETTHETEAMTMTEAPDVKLSDKEAKAVLAVIMTFVSLYILYIVVTITVALIYSAICLQIIARKTGTPNGWMAWIPIANLFLACNIGSVRYLWLLLLLTGFVPVVGALLASICDIFLFGFIWYRIALARGKEGWIGAITIIPLVGLFTMGYLAFSGKEEGAAPAPNIGGGQPANPLGTTPPSYKPPLE